MPYLYESLQKLDCFAKDLTEEECKDILQDKDAGSYIIRPSDSSDNELEIYYKEKEEVKRMLVANYSSEIVLKMLKNPDNQQMFKTPISIQDEVEQLQSRRSSRI